MKMPKTLQHIQLDRSVDIYPVNYKSQGINVKRKGWDICEKGKRNVIGDEDKIQYIYFSLEPVNYSNGDKWFLRNVPRNYPENAPRYFKRLSKNMFKGFDIWFRSFYCR